MAEVRISVRGCVRGCVEGCDVKGVFEWVVEGVQEDGLEGAVY